MTPQAALVELLAPVAANKDAAALLSNHELNQWPDTAVAALKIQRLLVKAQPATTAICPGCERDCVMPVHTRIHPSRGAVSFIDCDKRSDVSRVPVPVDRLEQWRCTADAVCSFVAASLGLRQSDKQRQPVFKVVVGRNTVRNMDEINELGDLAMMLFTAIGEQPLTPEEITTPTADNRYTPSNAKREARKVDTQAMYKDWQKAYRELVKKRPNMPETWYAQQIAKLPVAKGRNAGTIKKNMHA